MQKITPFLWFDNNAEEAMHFYASIFKDLKIVGARPGPDGKMMTGTFELLGDPDREKAGRVMQAMLGMKKIDIAGLKKAYEG